MTNNYEHDPILFHLKALVENYIKHIRSSQLPHRAVPSFMLQNLIIQGNTAKAVAYMDGLIEGARWARTQEKANSNKNEA